MRGMTIPAINYLAVLVAGASSMLVGAVWYARPVFGNAWIRLAKVNTEQGTSPVLPLLLTLLLSLLTAVILAGSVALAHAFYGGSFLVNALVTALILWAGFTAARFLVHELFEGRPFKLWLITASNELVTILVMALIIGVWPPA